jgi:four helix bundle protein
MNYKSYKLEDLGCWQKARFFRQEVFNNIQNFPSDGYDLKHQILKAIGSVGHNIAEGFGRTSFKETLQFCRISRGSLIEVRDQLYAGLDYGFFTQQTFDKLYGLSQELERNINGYIGFLKQQLLKYDKDI